MTIPTSNAVPSTSPLDLLFNAEKLDEALSSSALTYTDRKGVVRLTLAGAMARISAVNPRGAWTTGTLYNARDVVSNAGAWYVALDQHTAGATFAGDQSAHWRVYQGVLAPDLADIADALKGSALPGFNPSLNYAAATIGWWARNAGVSLLRYIPTTLHAAIVAGTNTTDLTTYIQAALDAALTSGFSLQGHGYTYKCNSALTWRRSSGSHAKRMTLQGAVFDFSAISGSTVALTVGATSTTYFLEDGRVTLRDITLIGPESADPRDTSNSTTTTGLGLTYAGGVTLDNVNCFNFYKGYYSLWVFPLKAINCNFRRSWVGAHFDEVSNLQEWDGLTVPNCRYGILIRSDSTSLDSGKTNTLTFRRPWIEGTCVGMVIDTDAGVSGSGQIRHRGIQVVDPYLSSPAGSVNPSDFFRIGTRWTLANPTTRGANCSEFVSDFTLTCNGGLINPSAGVFTSTQALVAFDSTSVRCRNFQLNAIATSVRIDADSIVNAPFCGWARTSGYPGVSDNLIEETWWDNSTIVRRLWPNGAMSGGSARTTQGSTSQVGFEMDPAGVQYLVRSGGQVADWNRDGSDGTLATFRRSNTAVGSISVTTTATAFNTSSDYRLKQDVTPADQAKAVQAVLSWPMREFAFKAEPGRRQFGVLAHELQAVKPDAVTGEKDGEDMQGVDYSKLIPEMVVALQYLLAKDQQS